MHIKIHRYDPRKEEKPVLPSSRNLRKQDLNFLRFILIMLVIALLYNIAYKAVIMNKPYEKTGILQNVQEVKSGGRRFKTPIGLNLLVDGEEYYLSGKYIKWDEYYFSGRQIDGKTTDPVWKIRNLQNELNTVVDQSITIQYLEYNKYFDIDNLKIIGAVSGENEWINMDYALSVCKAQVLRNGIIILFSILVCGMLFYLRKNYILEIKK